jgi:5-methylthioadenosine/S-adenosylhomocysteine deaminase
MADETKSETGFSRRRFLGTGALAAGAALVGGGVAEAADAAKAGGTTLIKGGCVLTMDHSLGDFAKADVLIEGGKIKAVRPSIDAPAATVVDAADSIVLPGFVDTHHHLWETVIRNATPDDTLQDYYKHVNLMLGSAYRPEDVHAGNLVGALGTLNAGTTTVWDWSHIQNSPAHSDAAVHGLMESGSRVVFGYGFPILADPKAKWWEDKSHKYPDDMVRLKKQFFSSDDQLVTLGLSSVSPGATPDDQVQRVWNVARSVGARISVHAGTLGKTGLMEPLGRIGLLKNDVTYVHCNAFNDNEWKLLVDTGGTVSCSVPIEMFMGHGIPSIQRALDFGIRPSLSVDVETQAPGDMFSQMRGALAIQRMLASDRAAKGDKNAPKWISARDVLEFATIEGARAVGLDHKIGTLSPGKAADIILLRTDRLNIMPLNTAVGAAVLSMDSSNVDTIFVAGKMVKRNGKMIGVDVKRLDRMIGAARDRVMAAAKFPMARV